MKYVDHEQERLIRAWLRQPKRTKPGLTHALHSLWNAHKELERDYDDLVARVAVGISGAVSRVAGAGCCRPPLTRPITAPHSPDWTCGVCGRVWREVCMPYLRYWEEVRGPTP